MEMKKNVSTLKSFFEPINVVITNENKEVNQNINFPRSTPYKYIFQHIWFYNRDFFI